ncbi:hypothetical protein QIH97_gp10 [Enterobacter phage KNP3]|nr:hypothetical protein QIH97_gp10 [Enterobacter phage KNP3]
MHLSLTNTEANLYSTSVRVPLHCSGQTLEHWVLARITNGRVNREASL